MSNISNITNFASKQAADPAPPTRAEINRANAAKSTGPRSPEGKAASSANAFRHGLCAQKLILPPDEQHAFLTFSKNLANDLRAVGETEQILAQNMAGAQLQIERARAIENNLLQLEALEHTAAADPARDFELDHAKGLVYALEKNIRTLDLISRYTARHSRVFLQNHARLREMQKDRIKALYENLSETKKRHGQALAKHQQAAAAGQATPTNQLTTNNSGFVSQPVAIVLQACENSIQASGQGSNLSPVAAIEDAKNSENKAA